MAEFELNILGCGSASPSLRHLPSCQAVEFRGRVMLIDCGECAQLSVRRQQLKFSRITDVFISHLHGDHFLGLPGLLSTLSLNEIGGRVRIHIFEEGARLLKDIMSVVCHETSFEVEFNIIKPGFHGIIHEDNGMTVTAFPLKHTVPCTGFRFDEKPKLRHLRGDMVKFLEIPVRELPLIKAGADFMRPDGEIVPNERLTTPADHSASYAYCSDTIYDPSLVNYVRGVDLLYHEATYGDDCADKARLRGHSTAAQAAAIARDAGVRKLLIGHYSKRYIDSAPLLTEARAIFPDTIASDEGMKIPLS